MHHDRLKENKIYIIAEAGVNHNGNMAEARRFIRAAALAGADAVKFQTFEVKENYNVKATPAAKLAWAKALELPRVHFKELASLCKKNKIDFLSTPFDVPSAKWLDGIGMKAFKIASSELCNVPLLRYVASRGKPIFLSVGMALPQEIKMAVDVINRHWPKTTKTKPCLSLLHCVSVYPAPVPLTNLKKIISINKEFKVPAGFSDHSVGIDLPIASAALGATVIEKHFKLSNNARCPDAAISLDPIMFKAMVQGIRHVEAALGAGGLGLSPEERTSRQRLRKGIVASRDMVKGTLIKEEDILLRKPAGAIGMEKYFEVVGNRLIKGIKQNQSLTQEHLQKKLRA